MKIILVGAVLCVIGAVLLDCHIQITGVTFVSLGMGTIILGPLAIQL